MTMGGQQDAVREELRCSCGGALELGVASTYAFEDEFGRKTVMHHVPAAICGRCGDVQVEPETLARIERRLRKVEYLLRRSEHVDFAAD